MVVGLISGGLGMIAIGQGLRLLLLGDTHEKSHPRRKLRCDARGRDGGVRQELAPRVTDIQSN